MTYSIFQQTPFTIEWIDGFFFIRAPSPDGPFCVADDGWYRNKSKEDDPSSLSPILLLTIASQPYPNDIAFCVPEAKERSFHELDDADESIFELKNTAKKALLLGLLMEKI